MQISFNRQCLAQAFSTAAVVAPIQCPLPILCNILLDASEHGLFLRATNRDMDIRVPVIASASQTGRLLLRTQTFHKILAESNCEDVSIAEDIGILDVTAGQATYRLPTSNPDEFPAVDVQLPERRWTVKGDILRTMLRLTQYCVGESSRFPTDGLLFELGEDSFNVVATDGRRLSVFTTQVGGEHTPTVTAVVPALAAKVISRVVGNADVTFGFTTSSIVLSTDLVALSCRLLEGRFPNWRDIVPSGGETVITAAVEPLFLAIRQVAIATDKEAPGITWEVDSRGIQMSATAPNCGDARVTVVTLVEGAAVTVKLSGQYLREFLWHIAGEPSVKIYIRDSRHAVRFTCGSYCHIMMPME